MEGLTEILTVYANLTFKTFDSKKAAIKTNPIFMAEQYIYSDFPISTDLNRKKYSFHIYDKDSNAYTLQCDNWRVLSVINYYYYDWITEIKLVDPLGEIRDIKLTNLGDGLKSLIQLQFFLNEFMGFKDWTYYELKMENEELKKVIRDLKEDID